jgi:hypothetical protein
MLRVLALIVSLSLATPCLAQASRSAAAAQYWRLKEERVRADREPDRANFEALLADDFVGLGPDGRRVGRAEYLASEFPQQGGQGVSTNTEVSNFTAVRRGATLVMTYDEVERTAVGENVFQVRLARLDVYVRERGRWRLQTMTAVRAPEAPQTIAMSAAQLADYVGVYQFGPGLTSRVRLEGGALVEQTTGQEQSQLQPIGPDLFYQPPDLVARVAFERDANGRVVAQVYRAVDQAVRAARIE